MNTNDQNNNLRKIIPILTDENYSEWKLQMIICLKQRRLYQYLIEQCITGEGVTRTPAVEAKIIDANIEACGLITNFLDSRMFSALVTSEEITQSSYLLWKKVNERFALSMFNSKARIWSKFQKLTYNNSLKDFIANTRKCLNDIASVRIAVEGEILAFSILTKLPGEFHLLIEKVTLNAETQGNPHAILNVIHEATLKEEALSIDNTRGLVLKKENFLSKIVHYCSNGKHNPLVTTHGPEKCWQLHPKLKPERRQKEIEQKENFTIAHALFTHETREKSQLIKIVLDTGASTHMFNNKSFFKNLHPNHQAKVATGCGKFTLISQGRGLANIFHCLGNLWMLPNSLYVPYLKTNLLSLSSIAKRKTQIKKTTSHFKVYLENNNKPSLIFPITSGILETHIKLSNSFFLNTQVKENGSLLHKQ
ncbi:hypothetical protein O181_010522 [Austropuccinia psidii MF-1]|uniref:Retrovirus-related Pol polyprotein from transposon TNT 1-94-like beta-barrel domain-containing protein n=1 Tax=Austropuccinia psidii MF-1 TaxID=1389203 RepID=A0A9Q3BTW6_9BASI|nr:hypothetical protein [Austropuccinia psidii MF-1]